MFTIRGKLLIYALEIVTAAILLVSMPPWDWWVQAGLTALAVFAIALATVLGRSIARSLDQLVSATRRIGEGHYDDPVPARTGDEIGLLGAEIDRMREQLRDKVRQLEELNRDLERKVEERTEALREASERLSLIHEVTNAVNSSLDFQRIFAAVVDGTRRLVDFDQASITRVVDPQTATVFAISGNPGGLQGKRIPLAGSRVADVVRRREPAVYDVALGGVDEDTLSLSASRREVVLPLVVGDQAIGTFHLGSRRQDAFSASDVAVLSQIAAELGVALLQADAYEREHEAALRLKELSELKSEFISKVSHELRTPLTSIMGAADNLLDGITGPLDERPRSYLVRIKDNSHRLLRLINELLDLSRIEAGKEEVLATRFPLDALIRETLETLRPLAEEHRVQVAAVEPPALTIRADRDKISRVLINLLHNGIKFTPAGGRVDVRVVDERGIVKLLVRDSGVGIPAVEIERVFDKFHQVQRARGRRTGSGLGLAISRQLVEMHGGRLTVESTPGQGSTFTVALPVDFRTAALADAEDRPWPAS
ncbi:MAG: HAMP domain-containing protein [Deltaproteobacteria bacterium]|nr:HAMP domain-containing protein [Deltaproteobacteria bacterium]